MTGDPIFSIMKIMQNSRKRGIYWHVGAWTFQSCISLTTVKKVNLLLLHLHSNSNQFMLFKSFTYNWSIGIDLEDLRYTARNRGCRAVKKTSNLTTGGRSNPKIAPIPEPSTGFGFWPLFRSCFVPTIICSFIWAWQVKLPKNIHGNTINSFI